MREKAWRTAISLPKDLADKFDAHIDKIGYPSRSEAIRDIIRENLIEEEWKDAKGEVVVAVTIVYDHHGTRNINKTLNDLQHKFFGNIISSTHVHLDEENCLEIVIVRGKAEKVKEIAERLITLKGIKHGKFVMTTTGKNIV